MAAVAVVPPFLVWVRWPEGNAKDAKEVARKAAAKRASKKAIAQTVGDDKTKEEAGLAAAKAARIEDFWSVVCDKWKGKLNETLPGLVDWSFTESWASNVGLAGAVFTGVFVSNSDILKGLVGEDAAGTLLVIAVASALSVGLIGAGPLFLTIFKRRWADKGHGVAKDNTVLGVLVASFFVLFGSTGLVIAVTVALGLVAVWVLASLALVLLLVYSWKSIPQTLALGSHQGGSGKAAALQ